MGIFTFIIKHPKTLTKNKMTSVPTNSDTVIAIQIGGINNFDISADHTVFQTKVSGVFNIRVGVTLQPPPKQDLGGYKVYLSRGISKFYANEDPETPFVYTLDETIGFAADESWSVHVVNKLWPTTSVIDTTAVAFML